MRSESTVARALSYPARAYMRHMPWAPLRRPLAREFLDPALRASPRPFRTKVAHGAVMQGTTEDIIQRYLYEFGLWEPNLTAFVRERLQPGRVFIDVGANIGYFTLMAARLVGQSGAVVAVEADPDVFAHLSHHIAVNSFDNVRALQLAASDRAGSLALYRADADNCGATTTVGQPGMEPSEVVPAAPLHDVLQPDEVARAALIKIDVEGAELAVLRGLEPVLNAMPADVELVVEVTPDDNASSEAVALLWAHGFHAYQLENVYRPGAYATTAEPRRPRRLRGAVISRTDIVFSRIDGLSL